MVYDLAIHPEYVKEMREEAEAAIADYGWSKAAVQNMRKVDSFMKESLRLNTVGSRKFSLLDSAVPLTLSCLC